MFLRAFSTNLGSAFTKVDSFCPLYGYRLGLISSPPFKYGIIKIKRLEKQHEILEYRKGTIIEFVEQNSELSSRLISKLENDNLNRYDIEKLYKLAFSSLLADRTQEIVYQVEIYLKSLHSTDKIEENRKALSNSIIDTFTYLSNEISKLTRTQYEIMEELREAVSAPPKPFGFRRKNKQDSTQSQQVNRYKKQDLYRSL